MTAPLPRSIVASSLLRGGGLDLARRRRWLGRYSGRKRKEEDEGRRRVLPWGGAGPHMMCGADQTLFRG